MNPPERLKGRGSLPGSSSALARGMERRQGNDLVDTPQPLRALRAALACRRAWMRSSAGSGVVPFSVWASIRVRHSHPGPYFYVHVAGGESCDSALASRMVASISRAAMKAGGRGHALPKE